MYDWYKVKRSAKVIFFKCNNAAIQLFVNHGKILKKTLGVTRPRNTYVGPSFESIDNQIMF